jgi:hypothetical protein
MTCSSTAARCSRSFGRCARSFTTAVTISSTTRSARVSDSLSTTIWSRMVLNRFASSKLD